MEPKFIQVSGFDIAYIEKNEIAPNAVFFIHGNSCFHKIWEKQFNTSLFNNYHLVAIDLPGHGFSSKSNNPEDDYSPLGTADIVVQILKAIVVNKPFVLVGFSYGTNLIAEMLNYNIMSKGIVLVGACVLGKGFGMEIFTAEETIYALKTASKEQAVAFLKNHLPDENDVLLYLDGYLKVDPLFRPYLFESSAKGLISDEIDLLKKLTVPVCIINGGDDKMVKPSYLKETGIKLWRDKISLIKNTGHFVHTAKSNQFNGLLSDYIKEQLQ